MKHNLNFVAKIAKFFLENSALTKLIIFLVIFGGIFGYISTPKQYNPQITLPAFQVSVDYFGARSDEVKNFITKELEEKIAEIPGVDKISSMSFDGGKAVVNVQFEVGEDLNDSKIKLWTKLASNDDLRIKGMGTPFIKNINPDNVPILTIGFSSEKLSQNEIREKIIKFSDFFRGIDGIANIGVKGGEKKALTIKLDPGLMKFYGISVDDVKNAILANNFSYHSGTIKNGKNLVQIEFNGNFIDEKDAKNLVVKSGVKLGDFAKIKNFYGEKKSFVKFFEQNFGIKNEEKNFAILYLAKKEGENSATITEKILKILDEKKDFLEKENLEFKILRNEGKVANDAIHGLGINLIQSILIVSMVLYLFLGHRPAMIVASAIPMTLLLVFVYGYFSGVTINRITLFALILSLGLLVDSATVITENIYRHIKNNKENKENGRNLSEKEMKFNSIVNAVDEVGIGLFLSTLTSIIVFLPTANLGGMMGSYMGPLSVFVPIALIMSLFIAYIVIPFLSFHFLEVKIKNTTSKEDKKLGFFEVIAEKYGRILSKILHSDKLQKKILFFSFGALFLSFLMPALQFTHFKMLPTADKNQFYVYIDGKDGTDLPKTNEFTEKFTDFLLENENVKNIQTYVGEAPVIDFNGLFKGANLRNGENFSTIRVNLIDKDDRNIKSEEIVAQIRQEFLKKFQNELQDFKVRFNQDPPGPPVQATLLAKIKGENLEKIEKIAKDVKKMFKETDEVYDVDTSIDDAYSKIIYKIDSEKALKSGITSAQISSALATALTPQNISQFHGKNYGEPALIELSFPKFKRNETSDLSQIYVKNQMGKMVPLDSIVKKIQTRNSKVLYRNEFKDTVYVSAEMGNRSVVYAVIDLMYKILDYEKYGLKLDSWNLYGFNFSDENGEKYKIEWGGEFEMTLDNFRDLSIAMMIAFILIYSVLVAQFKSFSQPGLIMMTIPLGLIGILFGFSILDFGDIYLTATALIGFIALMGIVVNNAIIFLEYLNILKEKGYEIKDALVETGKTRLRPIMLTSMTSVLGLLTIASDPVWSGLSWAIIFGLTVSAVMTLVIFPILYFKSEKENFGR